jgi:hypothetical protein
MNTERFLEFMKGNKCLLRFDIYNNGNSGKQQVCGLIYPYMCEGTDSVPLAAEILYSSDAAGNFQPLVIDYFSDEDDEWEEHVQRILQRWPGFWDGDENVVCVVRYPEPEKAFVTKSAGHPLVLPHLTRFHGMLITTRLGIESNDLMDIAAARLAGLIHECNRDWHKLV